MIMDSDPTATSLISLASLSEGMWRACAGHDSLMGTPAVLKLGARFPSAPGQIKYPKPPCSSEALDAAQVADADPQLRIRFRRRSLRGLRPEAEEGFIDYRAFLKWLLEPEPV